MRYWIVPSNSNRYRLNDFLKDHKQVDWKAGRFKYAVDDIIFIYSTKPDQKLTHVMRVVATNISFKDSIPDEDYWNDRSEYKVSVAEDTFCRFELIEEIISNELTLDNLVGHGLTKAPQSAQNLKAETVDYISGIIGKRFI